MQTSTTVPVCVAFSCPMHWTRHLTHKLKVPFRTVMYIVPFTMCSTKIIQQVEPFSHVSFLSGLNVSKIHGRTISPFMKTVYLVDQSNPKSGPIWTILQHKKTKTMRNVSLGLLVMQKL